MDTLIKAIACGLVALILSSTLPPDRKEVRILLSVVACCSIASAVVTYLRPVLELINQVKRVGKLNDEMIEIMWKAVGVGVLTEITSVVCKDLGNSSLEKMIHYIGTAAIFWLTIPLFLDLVKMIESLLERL